MPPKQCQIETLASKSSVTIVAMRRLCFALFAFAALAAAETVTIQLLATTDMHGRLVGWDYFTAKPLPSGLAKLATLIGEARHANPNTLLIDVGDTIEGTPLEAVHHAAVRDRKTTRPDAMMAAMNQLRYDAMVVGNHEYNFGLAILNKARDEAKFPWLSANTVASGKARPYNAHIIREVAGVKIGIFGITTPAIPNFEKPENYAGYTFREGVEVAREQVAKLKQAGVELIIAAVHAGQGGTPENMADLIARDVPGIDAIVFGHTHRAVEDQRTNGVLMVQPKNWAEVLGRLTFTMERDGARWKVAAKSGKLLRPTHETPDEAAVAAIAKPYHEAAETWLNTPVAEASIALDGTRSRIEDSPLVDLIHEVQMHYAKAPVSLAAMFNPSIKVPAGPITVRSLAALYVYENELYAVETTGKVLKRALETSADFFLTCADPSCPAPLINRNVPGYVWDMAQGVEYEVDLTQPKGSRIRNVRYRGKPLSDDEPLRVAVNNYRAAGPVFRTEKIVWRSNRQIRDLLIDYYTEHKKLPAKADDNWRIVPESAKRTLVQETVR